MKHIKLASALVVAMGIGAAGIAGAQTAPASTGGTITFTGAVTDQTCTVTGGAGTNGGTGNFTVALDPVPASDLAAATDVAGNKTFQVIIGGPNQTTCEDGKVATMSFVPSSPQVDAATGALKNALSGQATNTEVQVLDGTGKAIALNDPANGVTFPAIANNTATADFQAQYLAVGGGATAGLVSTDVLYQVVYN
jgi:major type 1 subunit fimbrin (pilin)